VFLLDNGGRRYLIAATSRGAGQVAMQKNFVNQLGCGMGGIYSLLNSDNEENFVMLEIEKAADNGIPVVPVLVDGAQLPSTDSLPEPLRFLPDRQAFSISYDNFPEDRLSVDYEVCQFIIWLVLVTHQQPLCVAQAQARPSLCNQPAAARPANATDPKASSARIPPVPRSAFAKIERGPE